MYLYLSARNFHIKTIRAGEHDYYLPRKRGTVTVKNDTKIYVYRFPANCDKTAAKECLKSAFYLEGKLTGKWPEYRIGD